MSQPGRIVVPFERRHFDRDVVALCVRWYLDSRLSLRDLVRMMAERGLPVAHTTLMRWVRRCSPGMDGGGGVDPGRPPGRSWQIEESRVKVRGTWRHLYRAVDAAGETVDFWLGDGQDAAAAEAFFGSKAVGATSRVAHVAHDVAVRLAQPQLGPQGSRRRVPAA